MIEELVTNQNFITTRLLSCIAGFLVILIGIVTFFLNYKIKIEPNNKGSDTNNKNKKSNKKNIISNLNNPAIVIII